MVCNVGKGPSRFDSTQRYAIALDSGFRICPEGWKHETCTLPFLIEGSIFPSSSSTPSSSGLFQSIRRVYAGKQTQSILWQIRAIAKMKIVRVSALRDFSAGDIRSLALTWISSPFSSFNALIGESMFLLTALA